VRLKEAGQAFALYLKLMFAPSGLHMERTLAGVPVYLAIVGWLFIVLFIAIAFAAYRAKRQRLAFALGFFLITWLPISGIFPLNAPMAEHWMYLPMMGFVWALLEVVWMVAGGGPLRYPVYALCYVACLMFVLNTAHRNYDWRNNESLYVATLRENPDSIRVNFNLGVTYEDLTGNSSGARREFERVLALYRDRKAAEGRTGQAETFYDDEMEAHLSLGKLYADKQMMSQAAYHFEALRRIGVNESNAAIIGSGYMEYVKLLLSLGRTEDARKLLEEGADRVPALKQQKEAVDRLKQSGTQDRPPTAAPHIESPAG
jgi:tetratricopeptide (TPR) repeat protein